MVVRMGGTQQTALGGRLLWIMPVSSPNTSSMPQPPAGTPFLVMGPWSLHHFSPPHSSGFPISMTPFYPRLQCGVLASFRIGCS